MKRLFLLFMFVCFVISFASHIEAQISETDLYEIGINDVLDIKVLDHSDLRVLTAVSADGTITFPYIGIVYIKGMNLSEIEEEITKRLSEGYVKYPVVTVSLIKSLSKKIFVYGEINKRGEILFEENMTVVNALSIAGGIRADGLYGKVKVRRKQEGNPGYKDIEIDLKGTIEGSAIKDMLLQPDDIVIVERNKTFFIHGEVGRPGQFVLSDNMTVARALSVAGGIRADGLYGKVKVRRKQEEEPGYKDIEIDLKGTIEGSATEDVLLQPDDIVIVERNKTFFIYGEVNRAGQYVLEEGMTVFKALSLAGGFTKWGSSGRVKVLRLNNNNAGYETIKVNIDDVIDGDATADINLQPGDIVVVSKGIF